MGSKSPISGEALSDEYGRTVFGGYLDEVKIPYQRGSPFRPLPFQTLDLIRPSGPILHGVPFLTGKIMKLIS